jgi:PBP1b-binding outer membrane lipoprotein LpoB
MKNSALEKNIFSVVLISLIFAVNLSSCSDEEKPKEEVKSEAPVPAQPATANTDISNQFDHPHGSEVTDLEKHKFEHDFAAQCVAREMKSSTNQDNDAERIGKSCECIATYMMKDLTAQEAEKFIKEREHPQSLRIKFEAAAYECLQEKTQPAGPKIFGKPTSNNL